MRSKHWVSPQLKNPFKAFGFLERYVPGWSRLERLGIALFLESHFLQADRKYGKGARKRYAKVCRRYITSCAPKEYHELLLPTQKELQVACKRRIIDAGYMYVRILVFLDSDSNESTRPSLARKNVELTNDQVVKIEENGVILESGRHIPADIIIHANGFKTETFSLQMEIYGPNGSLRDYVSCFMMMYLNFLKLIIRSACNAVAFNRCTASISRYYGIRIS